MVAEINNIHTGEKKEEIKEEEKDEKPKTPDDVISSIGHDLGVLNILTDDIEWGDRGHGQPVLM